MKTVRVTCVIGPIGSGKSTAIDRHFPVEESVRFFPGKIIREAAGVGFMLKDAHPNAPKNVDSLVLSTFRHMLQLAAALDRPLVCDGFPRTAAQAMAMKDLCELTDLNVEVVILRSQPSPELHRRMLAKRAANAPLPAKNFDGIRLMESAEDARCVVEFFEYSPLSPRFKSKILKLEHEE